MERDEDMQRKIDAITSELEDSLDEINYKGNTYYGISETQIPGNIDDDMIPVDDFPAEARLKLVEEFEENIVQQATQSDSAKTCMATPEKLIVFSSNRKRSVAKISPTMSGSRKSEKSASSGNEAIQYFKEGKSPKETSQQKPIPRTKLLCETITSSQAIPQTQLQQQQSLPSSQTQLSSHQPQPSSSQPQSSPQLLPQTSTQPMLNYQDEIQNMLRNAIGKLKNECENCSRHKRHYNEERLKTKEQEKEIKSLKKSNEQLKVSDTSSKTIKVLEADLQLKDAEILKLKNTIAEIIRIGKSINVADDYKHHEKMSDTSIKTKTDNIKGVSSTPIDTIPASSKKTSRSQTQSNIKIMQSTPEEPKKFKIPKRRRSSELYNPNLSKISRKDTSNLNIELFGADSDIEVIESDNESKLSSSDSTVKTPQSSRRTLLKEGSYYIRSSIELNIDDETLYEWAADFNMGSNPYQDLIRKLLKVIIKDEILLYCAVAGATADKRQPIPTPIYNEIYFMVHQFKFSDGNKKGAFNNTIYTYIKNLRAAFENPPVTKEKLNEVEAYFKPLLRNLELRSRKYK